MCNFDADGQLKYFRSDMNRGQTGFEDAAYVLFVCFCLFGLFGLINKLFYLKRVVKSRGKVLEIYSAGSGEDSGLNANIEFNYLGEQIIFETSIPNDVFQVGDNIAVVYDPTKPNDAAYDSKKQLLAMEIGFFLIGGIGMYIHSDIGLEIWNRYAEYFGS